MHILVELPADRSQPGTLSLHLSRHWTDEPVAGPFPCLGKADNKKARANGNSDRDPRKPWGDAPAGEWPETQVYWSDHMTELGEAAIPLLLADVGGVQAIGARAAGRHGLFIHAGRGSKDLVPTYGCIRMLAKDFYALVIALGDKAVSVTVEEM